ncbi:hypothetical protein LR48_Vigan10g130300 [Vigna angularis]|uniref:Aminotransferase-like plant mobile domain-containing protein n=1 Tax=Phaseolus angularis TaxID=3914 RepID=A0A0L9VK35_PHAAN|nr:hypothetical protein LR48_Vigan10g130300 [Vigna angularis]
MSFTVLDNIDNLYEYNWAKAVHTFVINSLGNASRKIRQRDIRDLGLSGNVAVLEVWAVERLGLANGAHDIVFLRIMNWRSLKLRSNKIEDLFKRKEICWEWFLREEDRRNSIICAALHLEEGSIAEDDGDELGLSVGKEDDDKGNDGKEEDGDVHGDGGADGEGQCFQTFRYTDVGGCYEGQKEDVEDVMDIAPVVCTVPLHHDTEDDNLLNVNRTQLYNLVIPFKRPWSEDDVWRLEQRRLPKVWVGLTTRKTPLFGPPNSPHSGETPTNLPRHSGSTPGQGWNHLGRSDTFNASLSRWAGTDETRCRVRVERSTSDLRRRETERAGGFDLSDTAFNVERRHSGKHSVSLSCS